MKQRAPLIVVCVVMLLSVCAARWSASADGGERTDSCREPQVVCGGGYGPFAAPSNCVRMPYDTVLPLWQSAWCVALPAARTVPLPRAA